MVVRSLRGTVLATLIADTPKIRTFGELKLVLCVLVELLLERTPALQLRHQIHQGGSIGHRADQQCQHLGQQLSGTP